MINTINAQKMFPCSNQTIIEQVSSNLNCVCIPYETSSSHPLILFCQFLKAKYPLLLKSFIKGEHEETCMDYNSLSVPLKTFTSGVGRIARVAIPSKPRKTRC